VVDFRILIKPVGVFLLIPSFQKSCIEGLGSQQRLLQWIIWETTIFTNMSCDILAAILFSFVENNTLDQKDP